MVILSGQDKQNGILEKMNGHFTINCVGSADEAIAQNLLQEADVFIISSETRQPVNEIQKIHAEDKHISVILLTSPSKASQVKQSLLYAPNIGKNALVVTLNPELDLKNICENAAVRTRQKRSFHKYNINDSFLGQVEKTRLAQMGSFLEYAPICALLLNDDEKIINYNQQAKKLFPSLKKVNVELTQLFSTSETESLKVFIHNGHHPEERKRMNLHNRVLEITSTEIYNEEGKKHFLLLLNDVSNESMEMQRIQSILEGLPQMAWTTDENGRANYLNQGWYFYTGQVKGEALGDGWINVIYPEDRPKMEVQWKASIQSGKPFQHAARYLNQKGIYRWHLARASAIRDASNQVIMWVGTCTDIHDQILLTEELERKVNERTHSLQVMNSELEQFAHVSSHDLQEPLRKIRTFSELLKEKAYDIIDEPSKRYLDKINATAERMSASLKALLNYTRLHKEEKFAKVNLKAVVEHALLDLELLVIQKKAVTVVGDLPEVRAIPVQMQQLFFNLIGNALKFTREGIEPRIVIQSRLLLPQEIILYPQLSRFKNYYEITVQDNGIGFEQKHAEKIFTIFQRLHPKTDYEGTGIGLSLVKKIITNHGGEIHAVSSPGQGTSFHIILPAEL